MTETRDAAPPQTGTHSSDNTAQGGLVRTPAEEFAQWLELGPKLSKAAGCYVAIKISSLASGGRE